MIRVIVATELIRTGLWFLRVAKWLHPKLFATFQAMLAEQLKP